MTTMPRSVFQKQVVRRSLGAITAPPLMNTSPSITVAIDDMLTGWLVGVLSAEDPQRALTATS